MKTQYIVKSFHQLTVEELYALLRLRSEVFVSEQHCIYQDIDNKDQDCHHVLLYAGKSLVAYARLLPRGISYPDVSIGRVVSAPSFRGKGLGRKLMEFSIESCYALFGRHDIRISAQVYALPFYRSLGFEEQGAIYEEDGIPHQEMVKYVV